MADLNSSKIDNQVTFDDIEQNHMDKHMGLIWNYLMMSLLIKVDGILKVETYY